jgi:DNA-binding response OmpR family regulator
MNNTIKRIEMQARILIVEDEQDIADIITLYLKKEGVETVWKDTGEDALVSLSKEHFDLVVLDINLPGIDGYETLRRLRQTSSVPVIIISARQEDMDMILGFGTGADDYVTKPFSPSVLIARIRAHLRRFEDTIRHDQDVYLFGPFKLDRKHQILTKNESIVNLSPREMDLLIYLTGNPGNSFSQEELYKEVWGNDFGDLSTVSVHVRRLRMKLGEDSANPQYIRTRYGYGYYFQGEHI